MKIIRATDYYDMSRKAANIISAQVIMKPNCVLGLATGGTPVGTYKQLVEWYNKGDLDFSEVTTVNLDEYRGLPREHPESYWSFMHKNLFDLVNIRPEAIHLPDGTNMDSAAECAHYDEIIRQLGGVDLQLLGIGHDGHIGFNEPGAAFELGTHCVSLTEETIEANKRFFDGDVNQVPKQAYTMGIKTIMQARKVLMVANGTGKADIVKKAFFGPVTPEVPASILQMHPDFTLVLDAEAAARLD
ncbi:glucosamine-6-phosphate deaminase [Gemmiger sp.]|uniref:glucosamine-6-phosphate deaminase n=1 Tax=Gemmiger sp. TaxID=2049027 RepID=UPI003F0BC70F